MDDTVNVLFMYSPMLVVVHIHAIFLRLYGFFAEWSDIKLAGQIHRGRYQRVGRQVNKVYENDSYDLLWLRLPCFILDIYFL
jgi:hypothetical protein